MKNIYHNNIKIVVFDDGKFVITERGTEVRELPTIPSNFSVGISCEKILGTDKGQFEFCNTEELKDGVNLYYNEKENGLNVKINLKFVPGTNVIVQQNTITNLNKKTIRLTQFSSGVLGNISCSEDKAWYENDKLFVDICYNKWQSEGQWHKFTPEQLGLVPSSMHFWEKEIYDIKSTGSWSTGAYYPMVIMEDEKNNTSYFAEIEGSHSWNIKLCSCGGYSKPMLYTELTGCNEENGNWYYDLKPNGKYTAERIFLGIVSGGFEDAVHELNQFKRQDSVIRPENTTPYVIYNTYMNALWLNQEPNKLVPLIKAAANAGCEIFCIDAGWSRSKDGNTTDYLGDWYQREDIYGENGLKNIAELIKQKGMIPGIWFEFDACVDNTYGYTLDNETMIKRYGDRVGGKRGFYNMKNEKVRAYLKERIRELYDIGFRYIKNDYNKNTGVGCTNNYDGDSPAEGLIQNADAFYAFINELYAEFPGLIIENCGSGALRSDNKILRNFTLQSTSDQELYKNYPSVMMGSMAIMPPEKAGVWTYPYPVTFYEQENFEPTEKYIKNMADGNQTAFNMVTAMFGCMYLSGRIDLCDEKNFELIREGVELYKKNRTHIQTSYPIYPTGIHRLNKNECFAFGTVSNEKLTLAVWNTDSEEKSICMDLSKWIGNDSKIKSVYPSDTDINCALEKCLLKVNFRQKNTAVFYEIGIK